METLLDLGASPLYALVIQSDFLSLYPPPPCVFLDKTKANNKVELVELAAYQSFDIISLALGAIGVRIERQ